MSNTDDFNDGEPVAWQQTVAYTNGDGSIVAHTSTNDDQDLGIPNSYAEWKGEHKTLESFQKSAGFSRTGISGVRVTVELDGVDFNQAEFQRLSKLTPAKSVKREKSVDFGGR